MRDRQRIFYLVSPLLLSDLGAEMKLLTQNMAKHPDFDFPDKVQYIRGLYKYSLAMSSKVSLTLQTSLNVVNIMRVLAN